MDARRIPIRRANDDLGIVIRSPALCHHSISTRTPVSQGIILMLQIRDEWLTAETD
jgi:hypothetical protein